ncbi:MAG TPA: delta-60 repeat domain-containing protein, partial [Chthoniobacterales bacterium]
NGGATVARNYIARLETNGSVDPAFDPSANINNVLSIALQQDGKILVGGAFTGIGGQPRNKFCRLTNTTAARSTLSATTSAVTWTFGGSSPQFTRVTFEQSSDGVTYTFLGHGSPLANSWRLSNLNLPPAQPLYLRARGFSRGGDNSGSESITESVRNTIVLPLRIIAITRSGADIAITYDATAGNSYRLERKVALADPTWDLIVGVPDQAPVISGPATFTDSGAITLGTAFYRVRLIP